MELSLQWIIDWLDAWGEAICFSFFGSGSNSKLGYARDDQDVVKMTQLKEKALAVII